MNNARIIVGDCLAELAKLPAASVHCIVTSPPYYGLRDYGVAGQMGFEPTLAEYVETMVTVFREVRRVLRDDGTVWLNIGDSYAGSGRGPTAATSIQAGNKGCMVPPAPDSGSAKPKDLLGVPWLLAFALRDDGWYLRQDIIWHKPNPMPESVTDRCTKAHEYLFLLTKKPRYYYDAEAICERTIRSGLKVGGDGKSWHDHSDDLKLGDRKDAHANGQHQAFSGGRNKRSVWTISTEAFPEAHFATFPTQLVEPCIRAGTSAHGVCAKCGAPWVRQVENAWQPSCECGTEPVRATVLDPFSGAGTTGLTAQRLGRDYIGIELNPEYAEMSRERLRGDSPLFVNVEGGE